MMLFASQTVCDTDLPHRVVVSIFWACLVSPLGCQLHSVLYVSSSLSCLHLFISQGSVSLALLSWTRELFLASLSWRGNPFKAMFSISVGIKNPVPLVHYHIGPLSFQFCFKWLLHLGTCLISSKSWYALIFSMSIVGVLGWGRKK